MLKELFEWWVGQMAGLVPDRLSRSMVAPDEGLLIEPDLNGRGGAFVRLFRYGRGGIGELGRYPLDPVALRNAGATTRTGTIRLAVPADLLLEKRLTLPLAAARDLDRVLAYELDRETPFAADEAWWDYTVQQRDRQQGKLVLRLSLIPKAAIADLLSVLREAGMAPTVLDVAVSGGASRRIPIDSPQRRQGVWRDRTLPLAAAACVVLLLVAIGLPFIRQSVESASVARQIAALKPTVDEVERLRRQLQDVGGSDVVTAERAKLGDPLAVLSAATSLLPDDTHLTDFSMTQRKVILNGQSAGPARLIGAFAADPTFKDPAFAAPSTHLEGQHTETFSIGAEARS
jgi:general secretion pathway protein L